MLEAEAGDVKEQAYVAAIEFGLQFGEFLNYEVRSADPQVAVSAQEIEPVVGLVLGCQHLALAYVNLPARLGEGRAVEEEVGAGAGRRQGLVIHALYDEARFHHGQVIAKLQLMAGCSGRVPVGEPPLLDGGNRRGVAHHVETSLGGEDVGVEGVGHLPDGRMGFLVGLRVQAEGHHFTVLGEMERTFVRNLLDCFPPAGNREGVELSIVGEGLFGPSLDDYLQALGEEPVVEVFIAAVGGGMKLNTGAVIGAPHYPKLHSAFAHAVEQCDVFSDVNGMAVGQGGAQGPEAQCPGAGNQVSGYKQGVWGGVVVAVPGEVVLGEPHGRKTCFFGETGLLPHLRHQHVPSDGVVGFSNVIVGRSVETHNQSLAARYRFLPSCPTLSLNPSSCPDSRISLYGVAAFTPIR